MPPYTEITPKKCKLLPDENKPFKIKFFCKEEINIDTEVIIFIIRSSFILEAVNLLKCRFKFKLKFLKF